MLEGISEFTGRSNGSAAEKQVATELQQLILLRMEVQKLTQAMLALSKDTVEVSNLDEIRGALNAELKVAIDKLDLKWRQIASAIEKFKYVVKLPENVQLGGADTITGAISDLIDELRSKEFSPTITVPDVIVPEIKIPEIRIPDIHIPDIEIPEGKVTLDLRPLAKALEPLKHISDKAGKPISVRLSDGKKFVQFLKETVAQQERAIQVLSQNGGMTSDEFRTAFTDLTQFGTQTSGFKALTDATAAVQVDSTSKRIYGFELTALGGRIAVGDSDSRMDSGNERGIILYPGNLPVRYATNNLNKLYAAGATGCRLSYVYYS